MRLLRDAQPKGHISAAQHVINNDLFMTKLLILSSDTGEGHNSAAAAIGSAASSAGLEVKLRKPLEESTIVNRSLAGFYNTLLTHRPQWMSWYFRLIDRLRPNERDFFY